MQATLRFEKNGRLIDELLLNADTIFFGREKGDVIIDDPESSSSHCKIQRINDDYHVFDLNSTNGTLVNGSKIVKARLAHRDTIQIGKTTLIFCITGTTIFHETIDLIAESLAVPNDPILQKVDEFIKSEKHLITDTLYLKLIVTYLDGKKETLQLSESEYIIGRASPFGQFSNDNEMSRKHAQISIDKTGKLWIEDLGSTNGVLLNGKKITSKTSLPLQHDIVVGSCRIQARAHPKPV